MIEFNVSESIPLVADEFSLRLMIALLHFLWQGSLIGILLTVVTRLVRPASAEMRYGISLAALAALASCVPLSFALLPVPDIASATVDQGAVANGGVMGPAATVPRPPTSGPSSVIFSEDRDVSSSGVAALEPHAAILLQAAPYIATLYVFGVGLMLMRLSISLRGGHRLRAASQIILDSELLALIASQARSVGLKTVPAVAWCERVSVPMVVGIVRPLVLLPCSLVTGLHRDQFAAIISHEFAHIRRFDLVVNLLQRLIESLLFFHPAVWLVSRQVSSERELCCDDLVVRSGYRPVDYAGALIRIAELCTANARPVRLPHVAALRASGEQQSELSRRVYRLLGASDAPKVGNLRLFALVSLLLVFVGAAMASFPDEQIGGPQSNAEDASSGTEEPSNNRFEKNAISPVQAATREQETAEHGNTEGSVYQLREDQVLKWIPPQQTEERPKNPQISASGQFYEQAGTEVRLRTEGFGGEPVPLHQVVYELAGLFSCDLTGDARLWTTWIAGDFVVRKDAGKEQILKALEKSLREDANANITLQWDERETEVWVVGGDFQPDPIGEPWRVPKHKYRSYVLYGKAGPGSEGNATFNAGTFDELLKAFGTRTGMPVVNSLEETPAGSFGWQSYKDEPERTRWNEFPRHFAKNTELVAEHFREQTGLQLRRERQKVRLLRASSEGDAKLRTRVEAISPRE